MHKQTRIIVNAVAHCCIDVDTTLLQHRVPKGYIHKQLLPFTSNQFDLLTSHSFSFLTRETLLDFLSLYTCHAPSIFCFIYPLFSKQAHEILLPFGLCNAP